LAKKAACSHRSVTDLSQAGESVFQLRILGALQLRSSDGRDVDAIVRQSKRAALLAYLAMARPRGPQRRDKLVALFWPESDELHARAALNQALYVLRTALGEDAIPSRGDDTVALDGGIVWCDALAFEDALANGRPAEALALYQGDLLDGFFVSDAPEFEHWLDAERERARQSASDGAWRLAAECATHGDEVEAARWAKRAASFHPSDEATVRRLMSFLHKLGDRTAAVRAYEAFAWRLSEEYELEPSTETRALVAEIRTVPQYTPPSRAVQMPPEASASPVLQPRRSVFVAVSVVVAVCALGIAAWRMARPSVWPTRSVQRFSLEFGGAPPLAPGIPGSTLVLSPNGAELVYLGEGEGGPQLFLRPLDRLEAIPIPNTHGAVTPFFSADGTRLGYVLGNLIRIVRLAGGTPTTLCKVDASIVGASWAPDGEIVYATRAGLWATRIGHEPRLIVAGDTTRGIQYRWPEVLPNGRAAVVTRVDRTGFQLAVVSLESGAVKLLGVEGTAAHFVRQGHLAFARADGELLAAPFDAGALALKGAPIRVADGLLVGTAGAAKLAISNSGAIAYIPQTADGPIVLVNRSGQVESVPFSRPGSAGPRLSPVGRRLALTVRPLGGQPDIWVRDLAANTERRLTFDGGGVGPQWTPDGRRIVFATQATGRNAGFAVRWAAVDAPDSAETLLTPAVRQLPDEFTPDGRFLLFERWSPDTRGDLWLLPLDGKRMPRPFVNGPADERSGTLSANGHWVAYVSDESGEDEVYARPLAGNAPPTQISIGSGHEPRWSPNGRALFYRGHEGMIVATLEPGAPVRVASRTVLFDDRPYVSWQISAAYDVERDGEGFIMVRRGSMGRDLIVVLNWFDQRRE
jgi:serine/threonine-protein kinase